MNNALLLPIILHKTIINHLLRFLKDFVKFRIMITNHSLQIYNFLPLPAYNLQVKLTKRKPTNLQLSHFESCRFYNGKHPKSTAYKVWPPPSLCVYSFRILDHTVSPLPSSVRGQNQTWNLYLQFETLFCTNLQKLRDFVLPHKSIHPCSETKLNKFLTIMKLTILTKFFL